MGKITELLTQLAGQQVYIDTSIVEEEKQETIEYTPNEKTAKILLAHHEEKDCEGFDNLDDLFHDLKN